MKPANPPKHKTCKACGDKFIPAKPLQQVCNFGCAIELNLKNKAKKERKEHREAKEKIKSRSDWLREVQALHNRYCRERDIAAGHGCISCGTKSGKANGGHYRSVGSTQALRFDPLNCHLQCERCNSYLSGNLINYRISLIKRIGLEAVEYLEGPHEPQKYTIDQLKSIKETYKQKLKALKESIS